jgi:alanine dehydrogenase
MATAISPLLAPMSEIAGRLAAAAGACFLQAPQAVPDG